jgi:hypothetical protein
MRNVDSHCHIFDEMLIGRASLKFWNKMTANTIDKQSKSFYQQFAVFALVALLAFALIYGLSQLFFEKKSHRNLVSELQSKTFGNRWVAAFELSKVLASNTISSEELEWVTDNLIQIYNDGADLRTKEFIVVALGAVSNEKALNFLIKGVSSQEGNIAFNATGALSRIDLPNYVAKDLAESLKQNLKSTDAGLVQMTLLLITNHPFSGFDIDFEPLIKSESALTSYSAKLAAARHGHSRREEFLREVMLLKLDQTNAQSLLQDQIYGMKYNALVIIEKEKIKNLANFLAEVESNEPDLKIISKLKDVLIQLKN